MNALKTYREDRGINQAEFARLMNVSQQTVSNWERNIKKPRIDKLLRIASILSCPVESLLTEAPTEEVASDE